MFSHAVSECQHIDSVLRIQAQDGLAGDSLGAQVQKLDEDRSDASDVELPKGGKKKSKASFFSTASKQGRQEVQTRYNHAILRLFCAAGLPPSVLNYSEWDAQLAISNPFLKAVHGTTLSDIQIPKEAAFVTKESIRKLKGKRNLTISFDGATTRSAESIYTVHITTPDTREAHLITGDSASGVSHTGKHLFELLLRVSPLVLSLRCRLNY